MKSKIVCKDIFAILLIYFVESTRARWSSYQKAQSLVPDSAIIAAVERRDFNPADLIAERNTFHSQFMPAQLLFAEKEVAVKQPQSEFVEIVANEPEYIESTSQHLQPQPLDASLFSVDNAASLISANPNGGYNSNSRIPTQTFKQTRGQIIQPNGFFSGPTIYKSALNSFGPTKLQLNSDSGSRNVRQPSNSGIHASRPSAIPSSYKIHQQVPLNYASSNPSGNSGALFGSNQTNKRYAGPSYSSRGYGTQNSQSADSGNTGKYSTGRSQSKGAEISGGYSKQKSPRNQTDESNAQSSGDYSSSGKTRPENSNTRLYPASKEYSNYSGAGYANLTSNTGNRGNHDAGFLTGQPIGVGSLSVGKGTEGSIDHGVGPGSLPISSDKYAASLSSNEHKPSSRGYENSGDSTGTKTRISYLNDSNSAGISISTNSKQLQDAENVLYLLIPEEQLNQILGKSRLGEDSHFPNDATMHENQQKKYDDFFRESKSQINQFSSQNAPTPENSNNRYKPEGPGSYSAQTYALNPQNQQNSKTFDWSRNFEPMNQRNYLANPLSSFPGFQNNGREFYEKTAPSTNYDTSVGNTYGNSGTRQTVPQNFNQYSRIPNQYRSPGPEYLTYRMPKTVASHRQVYGSPTPELNLLPYGSPLPLTIMKLNYQSPQSRSSRFFQSRTTIAPIDIDSWNRKTEYGGFPGFDSKWQSFISQNGLMNDQRQNTNPEWSINELYLPRNPPNSGSLPRSSVLQRFNQNEKSRSNYVRQPSNYVKNEPIYGGQNNQNSRRNLNIYGQNQPSSGQNRAIYGQTSQKQSKYGQNQSDYQQNNANLGNHRSDFGQNKSKTIQVIRKNSSNRVPTRRNQYDSNQLSKYTSKPRSSTGGRRPKVYSTASPSYTTKKYRVKSYTTIPVLIPNRTTEKSYTESPYETLSEPNSYQNAITLPPIPSSPAPKPPSNYKNGDEENEVEYGWQITNLPLKDAHNSSMTGTSPVPSYGSSKPRDTELSPFDVIDSITEVKSHSQQLYGNSIDGKWRLSTSSEENQNVGDESTPDVKNGYKSNLTPNDSYGSNPNTNIDGYESILNSNDGYGFKSDAKDDYRFNPSSTDVSRSYRNSNNGYESTADAKVNYRANEKSNNGYRSNNNSEVGHASSPNSEDSYSSNNSTTNNGVQSNQNQNGRNIPDGNSKYVREEDIGNEDLGYASDKNTAVYSSYQPEIDPRIDSQSQTKYLANSQSSGYDRDSEYGASNGYNVPEPVSQSLYSGSQSELDSEPQSAVPSEFVTASIQVKNSTTVDYPKSGYNMNNNNPYGGSSDLRTQIRQPPSAIPEPGSEPYSQLPNLPNLPNGDKYNQNQAPKLYKTSPPSQSPYNYNRTNSGYATPDSKVPLSPKLQPSNPYGNLSPLENTGESSYEAMRVQTQTQVPQQPSWGPPSEITERKTVLPIGPQFHDKADTEEAGVTDGFYDGEDGSVFMGMDVDVFTESESKPDLDDYISNIDKNFQQFKPQATDQFVGDRDNLISEEKNSSSFLLQTDLGNSQEIRKIDRKSGTKPSVSVLDFNETFDDASANYDNFDKHDRAEDAFSSHDSHNNIELDPEPDFPESYDIPQEESGSDQDFPGFSEYLVQPNPELGIEADNLVRRRPSHPRKYFGFVPYRKENRWGKKLILPPAGISNVHLPPISRSHAHFITKK